MQTDKKHLSKIWPLSISTFVVLSGLDQNYYLLNFKTDLPYRHLSRSIALLMIKGSNLNVDDYFSRELTHYRNTPLTEGR